MSRGRKLTVGEWLFVHLVILPAYLAVGFGLGYALYRAFELLPRIAS